MDEISNLEYLLRYKGSSEEYLIYINILYNLVISDSEMLSKIKQAPLVHVKLLYLLMRKVSDRA